MKTVCNVMPLIAPKVNREATSLSKREQIINYYEKAGPDYYAWSNQYNMHFGYYKPGMNPFSREAMLEKLSDEVYKRLNILLSASFTLADFGCGLGATLRHGNKRFANGSFKGITLVPWQVEKANELNVNESNNIEIIQGDYCHTGFEDNSLDAVIAIESSCYASGDSKSDLLNEIHRVLKPGGKFVIADGFLKKPLPSQGFLKKVYHQLCTSWALTELGNINEVRKHLAHLDFTNVQIENVSMNIAPSVAHVPFVVSSFLIKELLFGKEKMSKERWDNLKSPLLTMILGLAQHYFGYYFISGTKV